MNNTQIQSTLAPVVAFVAGILAAKFAFFDLATWSAILTGVFGLVITVWVAFTTRNTALANEVGNLPHTTVVTTPDIANALPGNNSVVSASDNKVVPK